MLDRLELKNAQTKKKRKGNDIIWHPIEDFI